MGNPSKAWRYLPEEVKLLFFASAVIALVLCIFFLPERKRAGLSKKMQAIHDFLNFKVFIIEKILQFLYLALSLLMFFAGIYAFFEGSEQGLLIAILGPVVIRLMYEGIMLVFVLVKNVVQINKKMPEKTDGTPAPTAPAASVTPVTPAAPAVPVPENVTYQSASFGVDSFAPPQTEEPSAASEAQEAPAPNMGYCTMCGAQYDKNLGKCPKCGY